VELEKLQVGCMRWLRGGDLAAKGSLTQVLPDCGGRGISTSTTKVHSVWQLAVL
jgi:hypothetical protein